MTSAFLEVSLRRSCENERLHRFTFFYVQQWHVELCFSDSGEGRIDSTVIEEREVYG